MHKVQSLCLRCHLDGEASISLGDCAAPANLDTHRTSKESTKTCCKTQEGAEQYKYRAYNQYNSRLPIKVNAMQTRARPGKARTDPPLSRIRLFVHREQPCDAHALCRPLVCGAACVEWAAWRARHVSQWSVLALSAIRGPVEALKLMSTRSNGHAGTAGGESR
jgi:hypothetical protein